MKIVIVGEIGAFGEMWAAALHAAAHDVTILGANQATFDAINRDGPTVETVIGHAGAISRMTARPSTRTCS